MSKIRNSLGLLVLPATEESMTWEQYKEKYGIDLRSIVDVSSGEPTLKPSISKVLVMDQTDAATGFGYDIGSNCLRLAPIVSISTDSGGEGVVDYDLLLSSSMFIIILRHSVYEDDSAPDEFTIFTQEI